MEVKGLSYLGICRVLKARHNLSQHRIPSDYSCQAKSRSFPFLLLLPPQQFIYTHPMQWSGSENLSSWGKEEEVGNDNSHTSGSRVLPHCRCLLHILLADTMWEQEPEQAMTATSAATTTRKVHLEITASESKLLPGNPAQGTEQMKVQGCHFKIPLTSATKKSSCPLSLHLTVHS